MSKVNRNFLKTGTGSKDVNDSILPVTHTAANYSPDDSFIKGHISGIDSLLGALSLGDSVVNDLVINSAISGTWNTGSTGSPNFYARFWDDSEAKFFSLSTASLDIGVNSSGNQVSYDVSSLTFNSGDYVQLYAYYIVGTTIVNNSVDGDIAETSFSVVESATNVDITGFLFPNATIRSFSAIVSVEIDATADLFEQFEIKGIQRGSDWVIATSSVGDSSNITFNITNSGQLQYSSTTYSGFVSSTMKFRAFVTTK